MKISNPQQHYDIAIIGGGMVGASFALALTQMQMQMHPDRKLSILVIESVMQSCAKQSIDFDARTTALSYGSRKIYERLGLWEKLLTAVEPIKKIHVSDRGHFGATRINAESLAVDALGYVVENRQLGIVLHQALADSVVIEFLCPAKITQINPQADGMQLLLDSATGDSQQISTDLVVLADGAKSALCDQLSISSSVTEYEQKALITNIAFTQPHENVAYERFTDSGPLAVLPLAAIKNEHRGALIWTLPQEQADHVLGLQDEMFLNLLQQRFGRRLGRITKAGKRIAYSLSLSVAREQIRPGLVLLGNVAHTLHPVAGQGLNLALRDVQALAEVITAAVESGQSPGSMAVLQSFVEQQQSDQSDTINFSHYITRLFSSNNPGLVWARKSGLFSIDLVPVIKTAFTRRAMGLMDRKTGSS